MKAASARFEIVAWPENDVVHYATPGDTETWCGRQIDASATRRADQGNGKLCDDCWQVRQAEGGDGE